MAYSDETNMNIAKEEYKNREPGYILKTEDNEYVGTLSDANDNRSNNGEQIYTYTKREGSIKSYLQMHRLVKEKRLRK